MGIGLDASATSVAVVRVYDQSFDTTKSTFRQHVFVFVRSVPCQVVHVILVCLDPIPGHQSPQHILFRDPLLCSMKLNYLGLGLSDFEEVQDRIC
jgi:hypothetical protein